MSSAVMPIVRVAILSDSRLTERVYARFSPNYLAKTATSLELE